MDKPGQREKPGHPSTTPPPHLSGSAFRSTASLRPTTSSSTPSATRCASPAPPSPTEGWPRPFRPPARVPTTPKVPPAERKLPSLCHATFARNLPAATRPFSSLRRFLSSVREIRRQSETNGNKNQIRRQYILNGLIWNRG